MTAPFIVLSLPRSRSFWAAKWLSYPGKLVGHDIGIQCDSVDQFVDSFKNGMAGSVETGAMIGWRLLKHELPDLKTLVVFRNPNDVIASLAKFGIHGLDYEIKSRHYVLQSIASCAGVRSMHWQSYSSFDEAESVWEWLLELPFDSDWWLGLRDVNLQVNLPEKVLQTHRRKEQIGAMKQELLARQQAIGFAQCPVFN